jgi:hypothetical protein
MNFRGFSNDMLGLLHSRFLKFLRNSGKNPDTEFFLPDSVNPWLLYGLAHVTVLPYQSGRFGMTYSF